MAKSKTPSPQEQYRARKAREEKERLALLPPGLLNHGNTCFMNSVLQGLIATNYLQLLVHFQPLPPAVQRPDIASWRSPVLTNAHGLSLEHDRPWSDTLPIGDHLIAVLRTAWDIQSNRKRENLSPKDILDALGKKYDQYLDFRQQDANEFLCQLLDAIRMEEMNVSKRSHKSRSNNRSVPQPSSHTDDVLLSFVDMLFAGKLASILVCQACKHVSHTYEDFTDLSLSMKPEDYVRERKRDKLKQIAKKIGTALYVGAPQQRSSSVPATPIRDSSLDSPEHDGSQRRRSIDLADVEIVVKPVEDISQAVTTAVLEVVPSQVPPSPPLASESPFSETPVDIPQPVTLSDHTVPVPLKETSGDHTTAAAPEKPNGKEKRDKDESWTKLSRRITVSVGLAKRPKSEPKDKRSTPSATPLKPMDEGSSSRNAVSPPVTGDTITEAQPHPERDSTSLGLVNEKLQAHLTNVKRSVIPTPRSGNSPSGSSVPRFPLISRPASPSLRPKAPKPPRPPKLSQEEAAYLRDILADINPSNIPKPFSIFKQSKEPSTTSTFNPSNIFLKVNHINRIEDCLRLFTSVEVLDGDNTVRCHRCWKIANGYYKPRARGSAQEPDSCSDSEDGDAAEAKPNSNRSTPSSIPPHLATPVGSSYSGSPSYSISSLPDTQTSRDTQSTLVQPTMRASSTYKHIPPILQLNDHYPIELVSPIKDESQTLTIPYISATAPESPISPLTVKPTPARTNTVLTQTSVTASEHSRISFTAPLDQQRHRRHKNGDSNTESEISEGESEMLLLAYSDMSSVGSSNGSPDASQDSQQPPTPNDERSQDKQHPSGVPRSRQYLLRPAYKRYLIATPPPILVVHLKRFQQLSKTPVVSFSTGFKKMDDYISFPEYLDLAPYLAPRREDYFDSKVAVVRGRARRATPCMYRLYTVVVHIGNMLGGHYVAYTALPPSPPTKSERDDGSDNNKSESRDWAFVSDTVVRLSSLEEVLKSKAYMCMYERV